MLSVPISLPLIHFSNFDMRALICCIILFVAITTLAQSKSATPPINWHLMDWQQDGVYGTSVNRAFNDNELLKGRESYPVIIAVIDLGVDTAHEDLKGHIWLNKKEIPGNSIDDDHNGYVDDVHCWNF